MMEYSYKFDTLLYKIFHYPNFSKLIDLIMVFNIDEKKWIRHVIFLK